MILQSVPIWEENLSVRTFDVDFLWQWKPAAILQAMTEAASAHAGALGVGYEQLQPSGLAWVLSRVKIVLHHTPTVAQTLRLRTWPRGVEQKLFFRREFIFEDESGRPMISAGSAWLLFDTAKRRMVLPQALQISLPTNEDRIALNEPLEKIVPDAPLSEVLQRESGYSLVDMLGHTNSTRYLEWIGDCFRLESYADHRLAWIQINYSNEVKSGERVALLRSDPEAPVVFVQGNNLSAGTRAFDAVTGWEARA